MELLEVVGQVGRELVGLCCRHGTVVRQHRDSGHDSLTEEVCVAPHGESLGGMRP
jgi:hypothetical protein